MEEYDEEVIEAINKLRSNSMEYDKMTKKELIALIEQKDEKIEQLENKTIKKFNKKEDLKSTSSTYPITYKIINFKEDKYSHRIELLWNNNSLRAIWFIEGTLKFFDKNNNLLGVDSRHICSDLNPYTEKAEVLSYSKTGGKIPVNTSSVSISITNITYRR